MEDLLSYEGCRLVFEDNFDGAELDRSRWNVELHEPGWVNEELQEYVDSPESISVRGGKLLIRPVKTVHENGTISYTSGRITTQHKYDFTYGLFEARLKVPRGKGFLPAFWLMTTDEDRYGQWPECGEIDIMEIWGSHTGKNHGTIHYGLPHQQSQGTVTLDRGDFSEEFHDFALLWEPGRLRWYVDSRQFYETSQWRSAGQDGAALGGRTAIRAAAEEKGARRQGRQNQQDQRRAVRRPPPAAVVFIHRKGPPLLLYIL